MLSHGGDASPKVNNEEDDFAGPSSPSLIDCSPHKSLDIAPLEEGEEDEGQVIEDVHNQSHENAANQLVVYNPTANGSGEIEKISETTDYQPPPFPRNLKLNPPSRVLPSVGAFTVQCANCFKWRLIPTKEKYEEIRENILQNPFLCETAREWRPEISCDDPADISQDGSRLWAIDKPNIAQPPPGWQRLLRIRGEGSTKFADVYYVAPTGKRLRSMVEVQKFLLQHPEYIEEGVTMAQFSFQIPKPLNDNYVRKRPARVAPSHETGLGMARPLEPAEVNPLSWAGPLDCRDLPIGRSGLSTPYFDAPDFDPVISPRPAKKQAKRSTSGQKHGRPRNGVYDL